MKLFFDYFETFLRGRPMSVSTFTMSTIYPTPESFRVEDAWKPLPDSHWNPEAAAHLLRRIGFSATPASVQKAAKRPISETLDDAFSTTRALQKSKALAEFEEGLFERGRHIYKNVEDPEERRRLNQEIRKDNSRLFREFAMQWFQFAREHDNSAQEKFVLFLQDIFVIDRRKVQDAPILFNYQDALRRGIQLSYPELCKIISREPGMVHYLDLKQNTAKKPNENFARELFELFVLGEGNYSENDIKEASRAFTGYRLQKRIKFYYDRRQHDNGLKTVFGETGNWDGDEVVDIAFKQKAARTFLVRELLTFYLTDGRLPDDAYIEALGDQWAENGFSLRYLIETVFQSRMFYHPAFRGNMVKSPIHFYLGLCQDLQLDVVPFQQRLLQSMRVMGQDFYNPPNVRGWIYGQNWINSTTISGRRQIVDFVFSPINEKRLNGNDQKALAEARQAGRGEFRVSQARLAQVLKRDGDALAQQLSTYFITELSRETYLEAMQTLIGNTRSDGALYRARNAIIALLQSPAYNLC